MADGIPPYKRWLLAASVATRFRVLCVPLLTAKRVPANSGRNFLHPSAHPRTGQVTPLLKLFSFASPICGGGDWLQSDW